MTPVPKIWPKFISPKKGQKFGLEMGQNSKKLTKSKKPPSTSKLYHDDSSLKIWGYINKHLERYGPQKYEKLIFL